MEREISLSKRWKNWLSLEDEKRCHKCEKLHGKIYAITEKPIPKPPLHLWCRCKIAPMRALSAGTATNKGVAGADWFLKYYGKLPEYYIEREKAESLGWEKSKGNLAEIAPGCMITRAYNNNNGHLPIKAGRVWQEADINYISGRRNSERILFSDDGLIFVTYDHYKTFIEVK